MNELGDGSTAIAHAVLRMAVLAAADSTRDPLFLGLALLIAVGGGLAVLGAWWTRGRDPDVGPVPAILVTPPTDLPPAVVGALIDEKVDERDIVATLADLGRRGVLRIAPIGRARSGRAEAIVAMLADLGRRSGRAHDFTLSLIDDQAPLAPFERRLLGALFRLAFTTVTLSGVRRSFAAARPEIVELINDELVRHGYFATRPSCTRVSWNRVGGAIMVVVFFALWVAHDPLVDVAPIAWWMPAAALAALGVLIRWAGHFMPQKTPAGAAAAAQWRAFARYLATINRFEPLSERRELFERYLPYAIVFGIERSWIGVSPRWYRTGGSGSSAGGADGGAEGGAWRPAGTASWALSDLQGWSDQAGASFQDASGSLFDWFDSAAETFGDGGGDDGGTAEVMVGAMVAVNRRSTPRACRRCAQDRHQQPYHAGRAGMRPETRTEPRKEYGRAPTSSTL